MPTTFRAYQPDQPLLLPPDLQEWVPPGHRSSRQRCGRCTRRGLDGVLCALRGGRSTQRPLRAVDDGQGADLCLRDGHILLARGGEELEEDVAFRMLAAGNFPQHRTFRRRHLAAFSELFVGVVQVAREMGLARFGKLSVDGTKVRANASKRKAMSYERMGKEAARLQAEIEALLTRAGMVDAAGRALGRGFPGRRVARGVATQGEAPGGDPGSQSAFGGGATRARRWARARAWAGPQSPGRAALQAGLRRARAEGAEQFRSREPDREDQQRGLPAVLRRWRSIDHRGREWGHRPATRVSWWGCSTIVWGRACGGLADALLQRAGSVRSRLDAP